MQFEKDAKALEEKMRRRRWLLKVALGSIVVLVLIYILL